SPFRLRVRRQLWGATAAYTTPFVRNMLSGTFQAASTGKCGAEEQCLMPCPSALNGLHLCEATIHKHFRSRDVAGVVGGQKFDCLCARIGWGDPDESRSGANRRCAASAHCCESQATATRRRR